MAVDNRPFKSKEQDGQGNEVIIRDQQLVEQGTATTMASGACFETRDVDDRPVKIPRDNMMNIVLECIGIILNDSSRNLGTNVQKALGLQGNTVGHSTVADFASVLGGVFMIARPYPETITSYNNALTPGFWVSENWTDSPYNDSGCLFILQRYNVIYQLWFAASGNTAYYRRKDTTGTWKGWVRFIGQ